MIDSHFHRWQLPRKLVRAEAAGERFGKLAGRLHGLDRGGVQ